MLVLVALCAAPAFSFEGPGGPIAPLTLVVDAERPLPAQAMAEMRRELDRLVQGSTLRIEWKLRGELKPGDLVSDLVLVKFRGECRMDSSPALLDGRGPLAFTYQTDGEILPFSEVSCERVRAVARSAMTDVDLARGDLLLGRALARVVAHEVYHIVSREEKHSAAGVFKKGLTGAQLIAEQFRFSDKDLQRLNARVR